MSGRRAAFDASCGGCRRLARAAAIFASSAAMAWGCGARTELAEALPPPTVLADASDVAPVDAAQDALADEGDVAPADASLDTPAEAGDAAPDTSPADAFDGSVDASDASDAADVIDAPTACGWTAFVASVVGPQRGFSSCGDLVQTLGSANAFDVDDTYVYSLELAGGRQYLWRLPTAGCGATSETVATFAAGPGNPRGAFLRSTKDYLFWTPADCQRVGRALLRTRKSDGLTEGFAADATRCPLQLGVDSAQRPYAVTDAIGAGVHSEYFAYPEGACAARRLAVARADVSYGLPEDRMLVDPDGLYVCDAGHLLRVATDGTGALDLAACGGSLVSDGDHLYTVLNGTDVVAYSKSDGSVRPVVQVSNHAPLAIDGGNLYSFDTYGWLVRVPLAGGPIERVAQVLSVSWAEQLRFDATYVYWISAGKLQRTRK